MTTETKRHFGAALLAAGILVAFQAGPANAATIYNNGSGFADSTRCAEDSGACAGTWTVFDDFVVSSPTILTDIFWTSTLYGGLADFNGIRAWIYDADPVFGGGNLLHTIGTQAGNPTANGFFFDVQLTGLTINLQPGTYWLGMQHDTTSNFATVACIVGGCESAGNSTQWQNDGTGVRLVNGREYAFSLESNITAVSDGGAGVWMLVLGLAVIALGYRRI
jgi:hypothetical protein